MAKPTPNSNRTKIEVNEANIMNLKEKVESIDEQVTNHIPHQLEKLTSKIDNLNNKLDKKLDDILFKLGGALTAITILINYIFK